MPQPASDAIASDIGHGALGVRYGLRPFRDLLGETVGQRHLWVEMRPKKVVSGWTAAGGGLYYLTATVNELLDGLVLDVVGVQTLTETLARYEPGRTLVAGTYKYDTDKTLYVYLTGGANPANTTVVIELGIHLSSHGVMQPILLPDRLANGSLDAWTGAVPDGWSHGEGAGVALDKTASDPLQGSYAARFTFTAAATAAGGNLSEDFTTLSTDGIYRVSGAYRATAGLRVLLQVYDTGTASVTADGRTIGTGAAFDDQSGSGEWKRFAFDFVKPSWATTRIYLRGEVISGPQSGTVDFDDLKLQPVSRYAYHEPLLSVDSLPTIEAARADAFWGPMSSALGSLTIANPRWEALIAGYDWLGARCIVRVGGRFQLGANEILMDDCPVIG